MHHKKNALSPQFFKKQKKIKSVSHTKFVRSEILRIGNWYGCHIVPFLQRVLKNNNYFFLTSRIDSVFGTVEIYIKISLTKKTSHQKNRGAKPVLTVRQMVKVSAKFFWKVAAKNHDFLLEPKFLEKCQQQILIHVSHYL